jgi:cell wall assembly regulator SMI1
VSDFDPAGWTRFERFLADHLPVLAADLAPPPTHGALDALAEASYLDLHAALAPLYGCHDGQRSPAPGLFFGLRFLPLAEAADEWRRWAGMIHDDPALLADIPVTSHPDGAVQTVYFSAAWMPFATDGAGNGLAVDLEPGPAGTPGQVVSFGADESVRRVLAPSAEAFVDWCAEACDSGLATVAPDPDAPGGHALHVGGASNLLDAAPALFGGR